MPGSSRSRAVLSTFFGSTTATLLAAVQAIVLMPITLDAVGPRLFGGWLATGELLLWLLAFDFGIPNLLIQRVGAAHSRGETGLAARFFATGFVGLLALAGALTLALIPLAWAAPAWVGLNPQEAALMTPCLLLAAVATLMTIVNYGFQGLSRALQNTGLMNGFNVAGVLAGFAVSWVLLSSGYGLWAVAWGLLVRSGVGLLGGFVFFAFGVPAAFRREMKVDRTLLPDFAQVSPTLFGSGLAYALMTNSQVFLAAAILGPEAAAVFGITRKAADLCRSILDVVGYASYGGFAHLAAQGDQVRTRRVFAEVQSAYLALGCALLGAYVWANPSLVAVWMGPDRFGGVALTLAMAVAAVVSGWAYLCLSLYRGLGRLVESSKGLLVECAVRIPTMAILALLVGPIGLAVGAMTTALASGVWAQRRLARELGALEGTPMAAWVGRFLVGGAALFSIVQPSWGFVLIGGCTFVALAGLVLIATDPLLRATLTRVRAFRTPEVRHA